MIIINGKSYSGNNLRITNNKVYIDGVLQGDDSKVITIVVNGNINTIEADTCETITINGDCGSIETTNGDVDVTNQVTGNIKTTNGNVNCGTVLGGVKTTNGNIKHK